MAITKTKTYKNTNTKTKTDTKTNTKCIKDFIYTIFSENIRFKDFKYVFGMTSCDDKDKDKIQRPKNAQHMIYRVII